jgi:hypothetical protein
MSTAKVEKEKAAQIEKLISPCKQNITKVATITKLSKAKTEKNSDKFIKPQK